MHIALREGGGKEGEEKEEWRCSDNDDDNGDHWELRHFLSRIPPLGEMTFPKSLATRTRSTRAFSFSFCVHLLIWRAVNVRPLLFYLSLPLWDHLFSLLIFHIASVIIHLPPPLFSLSLSLNVPKAGEKSAKRIALRSQSSSGWL